MTTKFFYIRDSRNTNRVITVARKQTIPGYVQYAFCVNRAKSNGVLSRLMQADNFDMFCKKTGREISSSRLATSSFLVEVADKQVIDSIIKHMETNDFVPPVAKKILSNRKK